MPGIVRTVVALAISSLLGASALGAQGRERADEVPKGYEPPRGMCRVWLPGVPPAQQPAPTDCPTAIRRRPEGARVIFGEPARDGRDPRLDAARDAARSERDTAPPIPVRALRGRANPPPDPAPADADYHEQLAIETSLDLELLASLYGPASAGRGEGDARRRPTDPAPTARPLAWAVTPTGRRLAAAEVERLLRAQGYLAGPAGWYDGADELAVGGAAAAGRRAWADAYGDPADDPYGPVDPRAGECFDRDFDGRCDDLSAGADGCFDRDRDGRCDDRRRDYPACRGRDCVGYDPRYDPRADPRAGPTYDPRRDPRADPAALAGDAAAYGLCFDRDRDGRCDEPWSAGRRIPQTLPAMAAAVGVRRGVASYDVERWLRRADAEARVTDRDRDGLPERVVWLDGGGRVVQIWTDRDGDGVADRVELFRDGLPVQVVGR